MTKCFFTGLDAETYQVSKFNITAYDIDYKNERYQYWIHNNLKDDISSNKKILSPTNLIKIMNHILSTNEEGSIAFFVYDHKYNCSDDLIQKGAVPIELFQIIKKDISHKDKEINILKLAAKILKNEPPFSGVILNKLDLYRLNMVDYSELITWINNMEKNALVKDLVSSFTENIEDEPILSLTPKGWDKLNENYQPTNNKDVFIAMAFKDKNNNIVDPQIRESIKRACKKLKWNPIIVDETQHNDGIVDKILYHIQNSRFVIADFTHHKSGVYYEAGYAKALGLNVIHTVLKSDSKDVHFDLQHVNFIRWETVEDLEQKLIDRIGHTIPNNEK